MPKKKFYALCRYKDKADGLMKLGYLPREGFDVPNEFNLDLVVYRTEKEGDWKANFKRVKVWYVVDCDCGLQIGEGETKNKAIENALFHLNDIDFEMYKKKSQDVREQYGDPPGKRISYL